MIEIFGNVAMGTAALSCLIFVIAFWWMSGGDWWRNPAGQAIVAFVAVAIVGIGMSVLRIFLDDVWADAWSHWSRALLFTGLTLVVGRLTWIMVKVQKTKERERQTT